MKWKLNKRFSFLSSALLISGAVLTTGSIEAADGAAPAPRGEAGSAVLTSEFSGRVVAVDPTDGLIQIEDETGDLQPFLVSDETIFMRDDMAVDLSQVATGDQVTLEVGGNYQVKKITIVEPAGASPGDATID